MKKTILAGLLALGTLLAFAGPSFAVSCTDRAATCVRRGGVKDVCYGAALSNCRRTGVYVGPYSRVPFPVSLRQ